MRIKEKIAYYWSLTGRPFGQFQKYQLTFADISGTDRDTPSSREIRAFFHFDRSAKVRKRIKISAISRSLRSFWAASISLGIKGVF